MLIRICFSYTLVLIAFVLSAQSVSRVAVVKGSVPLKDGREHELSLRVSDRFNLLEPFRTFTTRSIGGEFVFRFPLNVTETMRLTIDSVDVYGLEAAGIAGGILFVEPGDSIFINIPGISSRLYEDITFSGRGSEKYVFMGRFNRAVVNHLNELTAYSGLESIVTLKERVMPVLNVKDPSLSNEAFIMIRATLLSFYHYSLMLYGSAYDFSQPGTICEYQKYAVSFPLDELVLGANGDIVLDVGFFSQAKLQYLFRRNKGAWSSEISHAEYFSAIEEMFKGEAFQGRLLTSFLLYRIIEFGLTDEIHSLVFRYYNIVPASNPNRRMIEDVVGKLEKGKKNGIDLRLYKFVNLQGRTVSLSEFEGKVILIDFYFFGCVYCKDIAPEMERIEKQFAERSDLVFLSVSIDATKDRFKKGIGIYTSGTSLPLFTGGRGGNHNMIKDFGINGYPTLMLIGKDGQLIDSRAPAPRNEEDRGKLITLIKNAL